MKNPFPPRLPGLCLFVFLVLLDLRSSAQSKFGIDLDAGVSVPTSKELSEAFYTGGNIDLGFRMAVLPSRKLWIMPTGGITLYMKNDGDDVIETFSIVKAGLELQYKVLEHRKFAFFPLVRVNHNWCSNYFSKSYPYDPNTTIQTVAVTDDYLSGHGYSYGAGIKIVRSSLFYLKLNYDYFDPSLKVNSQLKGELQAEGMAIPDAVKLNCSSLSIGLGINLNFK